MVSWTVFHLDDAGVILRFTLRRCHCLDLPCVYTWCHVAGRLVYYPAICLEELKKPTGTSVRTAGVPAETRTEHLSETSLELPSTPALSVTPCRWEHNAKMILQEDVKWKSA
jgi:hypothetical protein